MDISKLSEYVFCYGFCILLLAMLASLNSDNSIIDVFYKIHNPYKYNKVSEKWLNYNLTPKEAKSILTFIESNYYIEPWKYNDKFTKEHFIYLFNLLSLDKNSKSLFATFELASRTYNHTIELGYNIDVIVDIHKEILPKYRY